MEFVRFDSACEELRHLGIAPETSATTECEELRFAMTPAPRISPEVLQIIIRTEGSPVAPMQVDGATTNKTRLAELAEVALHILHVDEVMLIPACTWGDIINLVAFDMASNKTWLSIDAEASMHQTRRDPLVINASELGIVTDLSASLLEHGVDERTDLTIAATGTPLLLDLSCRGSLRIWCAHADVRNHIMQAIEQTERE